MSTEGWLAAGFGGVFVLFMFATAIWLIASERQVPDTAQWMLRVIMALAGAGCGAVLSGMLTVDLKVSHLAVQATSGFALFVLIYLVNPPVYLVNPPGRTAQRLHVERGGTGIQVAGDNNRVER
jgi:hypothetical protein